MPGALVLAGTHSGCGKTSVTLGLLRALSRRGLAVQPFKAGPDFIDPGLHAAACAPRAVSSHNLDTWMMPEAALRGCLARHGQGADVLLVEGAMGLFDGRGGLDASGGLDEAGSTAHLAKVLGLACPSAVVLVVDAASQARSVAALVQGFARFDPELRLAGVILNRVGSDRHEALLRQALAEVPGVPVLGCLRRDQAVALPSRHLGLVTAAEVQGLSATLDRLADWVERGLDLPALLAALPEISLPVSKQENAAPRCARIGVARDRAFCFLYEENLRLLELAGAELAFFSPLADAGLPPDLGGLILPGGYPELAAAELAANQPMRQAVRAFCASGRPVWAECGGYMYLMESLTDAAGQNWPMCGALLLRAAMGAGRAALGYREARTVSDCFLGPAGSLLRGHEFHYSREQGPRISGQAAWSLTASDGAVALDGWAGGGVLGGYFHAHLASSPEAARRFVAACAG